MQETNKIFGNPEKKSNNATFIRQKIQDALQKESLTYEEKTLNLLSDFVQEQHPEKPPTHLNQPSNKNDLTWS